MEALRPSEWIVQCADRLRERWQTVDAAQLEEVAVEIWRNDQLRSMSPADAAVYWLAPVSPE